MTVIPVAELALKIVRELFSLSSYNPWFLNDGFQVSYSSASSLSVKLSLFLVVALTNVLPIHLIMEAAYIYLAFLLFSRVAA